VVAAVLLHDIGFLSDPRPENHHATSAEQCRAWLTGWSESEKTDIAECIFRHKGVNETWNTAPETIEQKIVCDADLLEKVGYIGLVQGVRVFVDFGATFEPRFATLEGVAEVLTHLQNVQFYTRKGRELAAERGGVAVRVDIMEKTLAEARFYSAALGQLKEIGGESR
jgi:HD superfamily phosphodiesterase